MNLLNHRSRLKSYFTFVIVSALFLPHVVNIHASWGLDVGRAGPGDVASLVADWNSFKRSRNRVREALLRILPVDRQRQLLGVSAEDRIDLTRLAESAQQYWLQEVAGPLQRIALNPAASCAEAQFAMTSFMEMERQRQLMGLEENETMQRALQATEGMVGMRCKDEALDECVATGRFAQIPALVIAVERQAQLRGSTGELEAWAEDALKQCAIYELHFISTTKGGRAPMSIDTVRDGRVAIKFEPPPGSLMAALRGPLSEILKGKTSGGNNPFFVSVKCISPLPIAEVVCSPGADSTPITVGINLLDLKHKEFYIESELSKVRVVGEDKLSFDFAGGMYTLKGLIKTPYQSTPIPLPDWGNTFYWAHQKDMVEGPRSGKLRVVRNQPGV